MNANNKNYSIRPLTEEERLFSEQHHNLIYRYMRIHELNPEDGTTF